MSQQRKQKKRKTVRVKGKCSCGYRTRSEAKLVEHVNSRAAKGLGGHEIVRRPSKS